MANVHGLGDNNDQQNNYQNIRGNGGQQMMSIFGGIDSDPRGENFFHMLKKSFCPKLKLISFTTIISALIIMIYIIMLGVGGVNKYDRFLSVYKKTLNDFGGNDPNDVKNNFEIFRWVTSLLLIGDFYNLVIAIFMILICYSILEASQGLQLTIIVFFGAGACGALFGDLCNICKSTTYSETFACIYACVGFLIGYIILYWNKLDALGDMKCAVVCFVAIVVIFVMMFTFGSGQNSFYDNLGELGGFLGGLFIAMSLVEVPQSGEFEAICRKVGYGFLGVQVGMTDHIIMNNLPFNKWTLSFINKQYEDLYEAEMNKYRKQYFRIIEIIILLLCILFFIFNLMDGRQIIVMVTLAFSSIIIFFALIYSQKFASKIRYYYFFMYMTSFAVSLYVASQSTQKSPFLYGYSSATIAIIQFLFSHFKLRLFTLFFTPAVQLYILDVFTVQDFGYIILTFMTQFLILLYSHYNEFMFRLAFSYMTQNLRLKEISQEYIPHSFLAISLNVRNNSFQLEFQNQISSTFLNVEDTKTLIEMMRNTYVVPKGQIPTSVDLQNINIQRSGDLSMRRLGNKKQTLEEFAFYKIKQNHSGEQQQQNEQTEQMEGVFYNQIKEQNIMVNIDIKNINYGKNYLLIIIKEEKQPQMLSKNEEQIRFLCRVIQYASNQLSASHQHLYKEIIGLKLGSLDNNKFWQIKCINLSIMNHYQNFYFFVNSAQINSILVAYSKINLKHYLINLQQHFSYMSMKFKKKFIYQLNLDDFMIKVNSQFLSQIIINIFEQCLRQADSNSTIHLNVINELNLNPLQNNTIENKCLKELDFIEKVGDSQEGPTKLEFQKLIKFEFTFLSNTLIDLSTDNTLILNPQTYEEFHFNNNQEFQLNHPITNFLLKKIGPYNTIQYSQNIYCDQQCQQALISFPSMMDLIQQKTLYQNKISFYIYTDQTQLTQSFIKYAQQKSFLQP